MAFSKEQKAIIKAAITSIESARDELDSKFKEAKDKISEQQDALENLASELGGEFDELSERSQGAEKGEKLQDLIELINDAANEISNLEDELDTNMFDDTLDLLKSLLD
jgi:chromosome segregation ATPase